MKRIYSFFQTISKKTLLIAIGIIILFQSAIFVIDTEYNKSVDNQYYQELLIQQILVLVQRLQNSSETLHDQIIQKTHLPNSRIVIEKAPHCQHTFNGKSLWSLHKKIKHQDNLQVSVQLKNGTWLNITAKASPFVSKLQTYLLIFEIITTLVILGLLWLISRLTISLEEIKNATNRLRSDLNTAPLKPFGPTIARHALQSINHLQERIQKLLQERMQMIAAISHDLRTPMARMRLRSDFITDPEQYEKNMRDLDDMEAMINETLAFVRDEHQCEPKNTIDLTALLISLCHDFTDRGHVVTYRGTEDKKPFFGATLALKRAFTNIIENAVKYAGAADIQLIEDNNTIQIIISDKGPGISDEELEKVFTPFYRLNKSRSRQSGGTGLGLTIARNIIETHHGELTLEKQQPQGLVAKVIFG